MRFSMLQANQHLLNPIPHVEWPFWIIVIKGELMRLLNNARAAVHEEPQSVRNCLFLKYIGCVSSKSVNDVSAYPSFQVAIVVPSDAR